MSNERWGSWDWLGLASFILTFGGLGFTMVASIFFHLAISGWVWFMYGVLSVLWLREVPAGLRRMRRARAAHDPD